MNNESKQLSFLIGLENLEANLTQSDKQDLQRNLSETAERLLNEIHAHLEEQDRKIDKLLACWEEQT